MNPAKFYQRTKLFNEILYEIFNVESNYRTELSVLNLKLLKKIEEHNNSINRRLSEKEKINARKSVVEFNLFHKSAKNFNILSEQEESQTIDNLMSEGLQQLLCFYKAKHKIISKEVSNLGITIYNFSSSEKKFENYDELKILENLKYEFKCKFLKVMNVKLKYYEEMNNLEQFLHDEEITKKAKQQNQKVDEPQQVSPHCLQCFSCRLDGLPVSALSDF